MAAFRYSNISLSSMVIVMVISTISTQASAQLSVSYYANTCPSVFDTIRSATQSALNREPRMGASLLRMLFHDCFVSGCDGGILLEDFGTFVGEQNTRPNKDSVRGYSVIVSIKKQGCDGGILLEDFGTFVGEQNTRPNKDSVRGYSVIVSIKKQVDTACGASVVSCADILAIAARDSVVELGGPTYSVPVGRRDAKKANPNGVGDLVGPGEDLPSILDKFNKKGLTPRDTVALSGEHTIGQARCASYRARIYNDANIDQSFAESLKSNCAQTAGSTDNNLAPLDPQSPNRFGNNYFQALVSKKALLHSDQVLYNGNSTDSIVSEFSASYNAFLTAFANAMVKMGSISPLTGTQGEIRVNCLRAN
ncbi:hypothetical protein GIB67_034751 [Kingdonia uniflora]|uniref:Peroxidase n=1 Tax=Kingdonia uniflora TaxID=39325 RepID=A0A7J7MCP0_9MAGN|nr:hypothetical protein GIB67_034751 [Kingdonia uniflora]